MDSVDLPKSVVKFLFAEVFPVSRSCHFCGVISTSRRILPHHQGWEPEDEATAVLDWCDRLRAVATVAPRLDSIHLWSLGIAAIRSRDLQRSFGDSSWRHRPRSHLVLLRLLRIGFDRDAP